MDVLDTDFNPIDGGVFYDVGYSSDATGILIDGAVDVDVSRQARRTFNATLLNKFGEWSPNAEWSGTFYVDRLIRLWRGMVLSSAFGTGPDSGGSIFHSEFETDSIKGWPGYDLPWYNADDTNAGYDSYDIAPDGDFMTIQDDLGTLRTYSRLSDRRSMAGLPIANDGDFMLTASFTARSGDGGVSFILFSSDETGGLYQSPPPQTSIQALLDWSGSFYDTFYIQQNNPPYPFAEYWPDDPLPSPLTEGVQYNFTWVVSRSEAKMRAKVWAATDAEPDWQAECDIVLPANFDRLFIAAANYASTNIGGNPGVQAPKIALWDDFFHKAVQSGWPDAWSGQSWTTDPDQNARVIDVLGAHKGAVDPTDIDRYASIPITTPTNRIWTRNLRAGTTAVNDVTQGFGLCNTDTGETWWLVLEKRSPALNDRARVLDEFGVDRPGSPIDLGPDALPIATGGWSFDFSFGIDHWTGLPADVIELTYGNTGFAVNETATWTEPYVHSETETHWSLRYFHENDDVAQVGILDFVGLQNQFILDFDYIRTDRVSVIVPTEDVELVPIGTFYIDNADVVVERNMSVVVLSGTDLWKKFNKAQFTVPRVWAAGTTINQVITDMATAAGVDFSRITLDPLTSRATNEKTLNNKLKAEIGDSYNDVLSKVIDSFGLDVYFDPLGTLVSQDMRNPIDQEVVFRYVS